MHAFDRGRLKIIFMLLKETKTLRYCFTFSYFLQMLYSFLGVGEVGYCIVYWFKYPFTLKHALFIIIPILYVLQDDLDTNIRKLLNELESANRKCEIYRSNLLSVLKAVEDHKLELSVKVENIKISMKDGI